MDAAERRLARVAAHLVPSFPVTHATVPPLAPSSTAASSSSPARDSYRRVHGDVPSEPPEWRAATDESGKEFVDIVYEKAVGEGIAKVSLPASVDILCEVLDSIPVNSAAARLWISKNFNRSLLMDYNYSYTGLAFGVLFNDAYVLLLQITINRPNRRNAFRPLTVKELMRAFNDARDDSSVGVIILTGKVLLLPMLLEEKQKKKKKHLWSWVSCRR